ncbi:MAG: ABC transporter ATP-binding protein, partial [Candidatus Dojkabacteria bacterium]|nr:ABC transporter ATP-binding protein [Candidatus Dojkabacteria bacterium]
MNERIKKKINILKKVIKFFYGRYTYWVFLRDFLFLIITVAEMYSITVMGKFIDTTSSLLQSGISDFRLVDYIASDSFFFLMMYLLLWIIANIGEKVRSNIYENIYDKVWADCNYEMVNKVSSSNLQDIMNMKFQDLLAYIPAYSIENLLLSYLGFSDILSQGVRLVTALAIMFTDLRYSIFILILFAIPEVVIGYIQRGKIRNYNIEKVDSLQLVNYLSSLALDNKYFSELRVDNTFRHIKEVLDHQNRSYQKGLFRARKHFYIDTITTSVIDQVLKHIYIVYLVAYSVIKKLSIGTFTALFNYTDVAYSSAFSMLDTLGIMSNRLSYSNKFFELMEWKGFGDISHGDKRLPKGPLSLKFVDLDFAYPDEPGKEVLRDINFEIKPGEKVAFYGTDSTGKSSLVKLLTGMYEIVSGDYFINDISIKELDRGELKGRISVVFQNFINYNFSLEQNIVLGSHRKTLKKEIFKQVLEITGLDHLFNKDFNQDSILGNYFTDGVELSPGNWQRVAIARMLYRNKDISIMDEPFTFIDSKSKSEMIEDIIDFLGEDKILIYIT